jgi:AraC-like DNA-binding protein
LLSKGVVRAATLTGFSELVREHGHEPCDLLNDLGLKADFLDLPDAYISFDTYCQLMENAAQRTQTPEFGLILGNRQSVGILGALGFAMQQSTTVKEALELFQRHYHTHNPSASVSNRIHDGIVQVSSNALITMPLKYTQARFKTIGVTISILKLLCGDDWRPKEVWFDFQYRGKKDVFKKMLRAPVSFGQPETCVFYDAKFIDRVIANNDPNLRAILANYIRMIKQENDNDFVSLVYATIKSALPTEHCNKINISRFLGMSARTLQRKLAKQDTTFKGLLIQARTESAKHYLTRTDFTITQISEILGYAELSVFSRAFKVWVGVSPASWKVKAKELAVEQTKEKSKNIT